MAAGLLERRLGQTVRIGSAGLAAPEGEAPPAEAVAVMASREIDIASHRALAVTPELLKGYDVVLTAESEHVRLLLRDVPSLRGRVFRMGHWRDLDIPDPLGQACSHYERCAHSIEACLEDWVARLE